MLPFAAAYILTGCELQPPPKSTQASTANAAQPAPQDAAIDVRTPSPGARGNPDAPEVAKPPDPAKVSPGCLNVATHIAQVLIDDARDPGLRSTYEQARANMVRTMAEACTKRSWSEETQRCYLDSKTEAEARACERKFAPAATPKAN